jgi:tagatose 1,6-diphosphate aldolase GatY/KbaY
LATDSSKIYEEEIQIPEESYTNPAQAKEFVSETGVDRLAGAVGTIHGIAKNTPKLRFELIEALRDNLPEHVSLVLHGGSGVGDEELQRAAQAGCNNIHISTELRVVYAKGLRESLAVDPEELTPYKYLAGPRQAVAGLVLAKIALFRAGEKVL